MTAFDYDKAAASALKLLQKFGRPVTIKAITLGAYDPATSKAATTSQDLTGTGALLDYKPMEYGTGDTPATLIKTGDKQLLLAPQGITSEPQAEWKAVVDGVSYNVVRCKSVAPAGTVVLYKLQLRRS